MITAADKRGVFQGHVTSNATGSSLFPGILKEPRRYTGPPFDFLGYGKCRHRSRGIFEIFSRIQSVYRSVHHHFAIIFQTSSCFSMFWPASFTMHAHVPWDRRTAVHDSPRGDVRHAD